MDRLDEDVRLLLAGILGCVLALAVTGAAVRIAHFLSDAPIVHLLIVYSGILLGIYLGIRTALLIDPFPGQATKEESPQELAHHGAEEAMDDVVHITRIAQEQACQSYTNITREASAFFLATEKLQNEAGNLSAKDRRDLDKARLVYLQKLTDTFSEGQQIIRRYLKGA